MKESILLTFPKFRNLKKFSLTEWKNAPIYVAIAWIPNVITAPPNCHNGAIELNLKFAMTSPEKRQ